MGMSENTIVIGLTGQSGAGKTTVCEVFEENGYDIVNADLIAREVTAPGSPCLGELAECFGDEIIDEKGGLNRRALADIVFNDEERLKQLNGITYPYITYEILRIIKMLSCKSSEGRGYVLLDAPTLFESRADDFCDLIISVTATEKNRSRRIFERDGLSDEQIKGRFSSQRSERFFINRSDFIIKNNKSIDALKEKAKEVSDKIKEYYEAEKP